MSEETKPTQTNEPQGAASNTAGQDGARRGSRPPMEAGASGEPRFRGRKRRKVSYLTINKIDVVDFKDVNILRRFINDRGKILSAKVTGNTAKQQRMVSRAIRRAREMALLPFVVTEFTGERPMRPRPPRNYDAPRHEEPASE